MTPASFTRTNPCTKVHLFNCFFNPKTAGVVPVVDAHQQIGVNSPKHLLDNGYLLHESRKGVDYYVLTAFGRNWLVPGLKRYLELHPEKRADVLYPIPGEAPAPPPIRRVIRRAK